MDSTWNNRWSVAAGLVVSLALHAGAAVAVGLMGAAARAPTPAPELMTKEPPIRPGVDRSRAITINWLGFEKPTEHQARQATTDQPALARGPANTPQPDSASAQPVPPAPRPVPLAQAASGASLPAIPLPDASLDQLLAAIDAAKPSSEPARKEAKPAQPPTPAPVQTHAPQPQHQERQQPQPQPAASPGGGPRESAPTSQTKPIKVHPGKPIAMQGLTIDTVAPKFTTVTRLLTVPHNPLVRLTFAPTGRVVLATIIEPSGYADVDRPVLDAVYAWKARGKRLADLRAAQGVGGRFSLDFRIVIQ